MRDGVRRVGGSEEGRSEEGRSEEERSEERLVNNSLDQGMRWKAAIQHPISTYVILHKRTQLEGGSETTIGERE